MSQLLVVNPCQSQYSQIYILGVQDFSHRLGVWNKPASKIPCTACPVIDYRRILQPAPNVLWASASAKMQAHSSFALYTCGRVFYPPCLLNQRIGKHLLRIYGSIKHVSLRVSGPNAAPATYVDDLTIRQSESFAPSSLYSSSISCHVSFIFCVLLLNHAQPPTSSSFVQTI